MFAQRVADRKPIQLRDQFFGAGVQVAQGGILYLIDAFDLADQQLGIADQLERLRTVLQRVFECGDQSLILGEVVGLVAEIFAERRDLFPRLILDDYAVASGAGVSASATVAVRDEVVIGGFVVGVFALGEKRFTSGAAGVRGHTVEFTTGRGRGLLWLGKS